MTKLLDRLHQDHVNMAQLLDLLDVQLALLRDPSADADYQLMRDIAYYFVSYPDSVHHPTEDLMFGALEVESPDLRNRFKFLRQEHAELSAMGQEFHLLLESVCSGQLVRRDKILEATEEFLDRQRRHMDLEEGEIFVLAKAYLSDEAVAAFEAAHEEAHDPVFGAEIRDTFKRLHEAIMQRA